jgi:hypothetical protein
MKEVVSKEEADALRRKKAGDRAHDRRLRKMMADLDLGESYYLRPAEDDPLVQAMNEVYGKKRRLEIN